MVAGSLLDSPPTPTLLRGDLKLQVSGSEGMNPVQFFFVLFDLRVVLAK